MTLPASGQIAMNQVNTELGRGSALQLALNDSIVRTLAGVPSGQIAMSNLHGKSNIIPGYRRPTTYTVSGSTSNPQNAYDTSDSTYSTTQGAGNFISALKSITFHGFPNETVSGIFELRRAIPDLYSEFADGYASSASVHIEYSVNGGSSYTTWELWENYGGEGVFSVNNSVISLAMTNVQLSQLRVRITALAAPGIDEWETPVATASFDFSIYDVRFNVS